MCAFASSDLETENYVGNTSFDFKYLLIQAESMAALVPYAISLIYASPFKFFIRIFFSFKMTAHNYDGKCG